MKFELFFSGIALISFAYTVYKTREWSNQAPTYQSKKTAERIRYVAIILFFVGSGLFLIAKSLMVGF